MLYQRLRRALDNRTASVSAAAGVSVEAGALEKKTLDARVLPNFPSEKPSIMLFVSSFRMESSLL